MATAVLAPNHNIGTSANATLSTSTNASPVMDSKVPSKPTTEATSKNNSPTQTKTSISDPQVSSQSEDSKPTVQVSEPLAPPPRPAQANPAETPDYFSSVHNGTSGLEFNPFEQSFGVSSAETPGGTRLPPVAALTSPAIPGASNNTGYNFPGSLRSGPLSPAMLEGPQGDYFGNLGSRGFPTPNESSLRTGLTPGGGGSMFPAPSPNSQALYNSLASGGATPGTLEFHRTAITAAAQSKNRSYPSTSNPQESSGNNNNMDAQHDATDAANGLFMLAKGGQANQFAVPNPPQQQQQQMQTRGQDQKRSTRNNGSIGSGSGQDGQEGGSPEDTKPATRGGKGKKTAKAEATTNGRRKSDAPSKGSNKKQKGNSGNANVDPALADHDDDDDDMGMNDSDDDGDESLMMDGKDPKKMTDEEKRRNFLERNRVAALKCRQRKKQWLANLQAKVEMYSAENDNLNSQVATLHEEIRSLRQLLMGHKDCPVGHAQGISQYLGGGMQDPNGFPGQHVYGMAMSNGGGMQPGMQRS